jgi:hypothetical protein
MAIRTIDPTQVELVAAARAGASLPALAKRFELDEVRLQQIKREYDDVPDTILFGIRRILKDNIGLKKIIADLTAKSARKAG